MLHRPKFTLANAMLIVTATFLFIIPTNTKSSLKESEIVYGPINPSAGQYADGVSQQLNVTDMSLLEEGWLNFTYIGFVDEQLFNVTKSVQTGTITYEYWLTVNVTDRSVIDGTSWWVGTYYFGWVPNDIEVGVTVALGPGNGTVQAKEVITVEDTVYETWRLYGELAGVNTTSWYDVHSGHWVKAIHRGSNFVSQWLLVSSNFVTPHEVEETPTASEHGEAILAMVIILLFAFIKKKR